MRIKYTLAVVALVVTRSAAVHAADAIVRPNIHHQPITGFGASSAWTASDISDADADLLFTTDGGVGLSLLRVRIPPGGCSPPQETCEVATALKAQTRGATVWATPWSPPAVWKSNGSVDHGGKLLPEHADDWASSLVTYVQWMQGQGVSISAVSAQNEPTTVVSYESCVYTPATLTDFIGNHLAPAFGDANLSTRIVAPETQDWQDLPTFADSILNNAAAAAAVGVVATHSYGKSPAAPYAPAAQAMKELWQTEVYDPSPAPDPGIASGLRVAAMMQTALVDANVNAWHYWWILPQGEGNGALWDNATGAPTKRLYAMGNYSRFVRPGFVRVETSTTGPTPGITFSAYLDPTSMKLVIVAINENSTSVSQDFLFDGVATGSWTSWVTSATEVSVSSGTPVSGGCNPVDGGSSLVDGGSDSVDEGGSPGDGGNDSVDEGGDSVDEGGSPVDGGSDSVDEGGDSVDEGGSPVDGGNDSVDEGGDSVDEGGDSVDEGGSPVDGASDSVDAGSTPVDSGCNLSALSVVLEAQSVTTFQGFVTGVGPNLPASVSSPTAESTAGGGSTASGESSGCACAVARERRDEAGVGSALAFLFSASLLLRRRQPGRGPVRGCGP